MINKRDYIIQEQRLKINEEKNNIKENIREKIQLCTKEFSDLLTWAYHLSKNQIISDYAQEFQYIIISSQLRNPYVSEDKYNDLFSELQEKFSRDNIRKNYIEIFEKLEKYTINIEDFNNCIEAGIQHINSSMKMTINENNKSNTLDNKYQLENKPNPKVTKKSKKSFIILIKDRLRLMSRNESI